MLTLLAHGVRPRVSDRRALNSPPPGPSRGGYFIRKGERNGCEEKDREEGQEKDRQAQEALAPVDAGLHAPAS